MDKSYEEWMGEVRATFKSLNLPAADWQAIGAFDYRTEYDAGASPRHAATKANHQWWHQWNKSLNQDCRETEDCWLPRGHEGQCQLIGESGATS
jgi:hypothetical protein